MTPSESSQKENRAIHRWTKIAIAAIAALLIGPASRVAQAQTFTVLYNFDTGHGGYGAGPEAGLSMDRGGNLYGTTSTGGPGLS